jgi:hypothetical protein
MEEILSTTRKEPAQVGLVPELLLVLALMVAQAVVTLKI